MRLHILELSTRLEGSHRIFLSQRIIFRLHGYVTPFMVRIVLWAIFYGAQSWFGGNIVVAMLSGLSSISLKLKDTFPSHGER